MDEKNKHILDILKFDSSLSLRDIARKTGYTLTTTYNRVNELKKSGIIKKYTIEIDNTKIGKTFHAYVLISVNLDLIKKINKTQNDIKEELEKYSQIKQANIIIGGADLIIEIFTKNTNEFQKLLLNKIQQIKGISNTQTLTIIN